MPHRRSHLWAVSVLLALFVAPLRAHDEAPKPIAGFLIQPDGERLTVTAHLPIEVLADANFPRDGNGRLVGAEVGPPLQLVAREVVSSLEFEQDGAPLLMPTLAAALSADEKFVDVELGYLIRAGVPNLSARLRPFRAGSTPVTAVVRFVVSPGDVRTFAVAGASERVTFNPDATTAAAHFVEQGTRTLLDDWDFVLFLICVAVPARVFRARLASVIALLAAEAVGASLTAAGWSTVQPSVPLAIGAIAASTVVIASLQTIVSPASRWLVPLALLFGLANGFALGHTFRDSLSFAGSHALASFAALIAVVLLVQLWGIAMLSSAAGLLYRWGLPERVAVFVTAIIACHEALDRVLDRSNQLAQITTIQAEHLLLALTLAWALVVVVAGVLSAGRGGGSDASPLATPASARP